MHYPELPSVTLDTFGEPELIDLDDRIAHILRMRSGMMGEPTTQREIGEELGIGRARISQLEREGLTLIRRLREVQRHQLMPPATRWSGRGYIWNRIR